MSLCAPLLLLSADGAEVMHPLSALAQSLLAGKPCLPLHLPTRLAAPAPLPRPERTHAVYQWVSRAHPCLLGYWQQSNGVSAESVRHAGFAGNGLLWRRRAVFVERDQAARQRALEKRRGVRAGVLGPEEQEECRGERRERGERKGEAEPASLGWGGVGREREGGRPGATRMTGHATITVVG